MARTHTLGNHCTNIIYMHLFFHDLLWFFSLLVDEIQIYRSKYSQPLNLLWINSDLTFQKSKTFRWSHLISNFAGFLVTYTDKRPNSENYQIKGKVSQLYLTPWLSRDILVLITGECREKGKLKVKSAGILWSFSIDYI